MAFIKQSGFARYLAVAFGVLCIQHPAVGASASQEAIAAWDKAAIVMREHAARPFKTFNQTGASGDGSRQSSVSGEMVVIPSGLLHHWAGRILIPDANLIDIVSVLQDYNSYSQLYKPAVIHSELLSRDRDDFRYQLKFVEKEFGIKVGLSGQFSTSYFSLSPTRGYSVTEAKELVELEDPGTDRERQLHPKASHGYVQRVCTIFRYQEVGNGVLIEVESLTLSRGVPAAVRWLIAPAIQKFSRQTMTVTLERLRDQVQASQSFVSASSR